MMSYSMKKMEYRIRSSIGPMDIGYLRYKNQEEHTRRLHIVERDTDYCSYNLVHTFHSHMSLKDIGCSLYRTLEEYRDHSHIHPINIDYYWCKLETYMCHSNIFQMHTDYLEYRMAMVHRNRLCIVQKDIDYFVCKQSEVGTRRSDTSQTNIGYCSCNSVHRGH